MTIQHFYRFLSLNIWGNLPSKMQRSISAFYAQSYNKSFSRYIIKPYCRANYQNTDYLDQFRSASGSDEYKSFQDFFTRVYKNMPEVKSEHIWPCEGYLCDYGKVDSLDEINVKGDRRNVKTIFGSFSREIPDDYFFSNVFLHNNNYHRIHAPVSGIIRGIEYIEGDLVLLRPWVYTNDPSLPAMRNERANIKLEDLNGRPWYLSIVGGPAVGTIVLDEHVSVGGEIKILDQIGLFLLGSTCCMVSPENSNTTGKGENVYVGDSYTVA